MDRGAANQHQHFWQRQLSRGRFLQLSAGAAAGLAGAGVWLPRLALAAEATASSEPRPIAGGIQPFGPGTPFIHVFAPDRDADPSSIGDFDGLVGAAIVRGSGKAFDVASGKISDVLFDSDMRFMKGAYRAADGSRQSGSFVFV
jgi:hypothetical protein